MLVYLALLALYAVDPYSHGEAGELAIFSGRPWQTVCTLGLVLLLLTGALLSTRGITASRRVLQAEAVGFLLLNLIYILRDGGSRFVFGYEHQPIGLIVVILGILLRVVLQRQIDRGRPDELGQQPNRTA